VGNGRKRKGKDWRGGGSPFWGNVIHCTQNRSVISGGSKSPKGGGTGGTVNNLGLRALNTRQSTGRAKHHASESSSKTGAPGGRIYRNGWKDPGERLGGKDSPPERLPARRRNGEMPGPAVERDRGTNPVAKRTTLQESRR